MSVNEGYVIPRELLGSVGEQLVKYKLSGMTYDEAISKIESDHLRGATISQFVVDKYREVWEAI